MNTYPIREDQTRRSGNNKIRKYTRRQFHQRALVEKQRRETARKAGRKND
jgi:hypothetical protein